MLRKRREECIPKKDVLENPDYMEADAMALRAVAAGVATEDQQKRAMQFIVEDICGTYDFAFRPQGDRETNLALGKQRAGQIIVWFLKTAPTKTTADRVAARVMRKKPGDEDVDS